MKVYKGTDKDMKCRGYQFQQGVEAVEDKAELCKHGFHACKAPIDVLSYYTPGYGSRYFEAELEDVEEEQNDDDSKVVGKRITIGAEIGIPGIVKAHVEYVKSSCEKENSATGDSSANSATGYRSANSATGYGSANSATGYGSANRATGYGSANSATGDSSANSATGYRSANSATGDSSANSATGYGSANVSTGAGSSNTGAAATINVGWGKNNKCSGKLGAYLVCSEWGEWDGSKHPLLGAKMGVVDGVTLKPDVWYTLKNGEFVEVEE